MSAVINNNVNPIATMVDCRPHGDCEININDNLADDSRKIFVGGLSWETSEEDLRKYFSEFGIVKSCIIKLDRYSNHSRGFGFVIFDSEETVNKVLDIKEHILNKKKIDPKKAKPSREPQKKVFVGGLDPDLSESMIKDYFSQFGEIENIETPFDTRKNKRKAYLFITFSNESEARKAASHECQEINGKKFEVRIAIPREQANRRWKGTNQNMLYPYAMLPYMYPEYFYSYIYNNPNLYNSYYNPYELFNYDPVSLSRQFSTGVMINNNASTTRPKIAAATLNSSNTTNTNASISLKPNPFSSAAPSSNSAALITNNNSSSSVVLDAHSSCLTTTLPNGNVFMPVPHSSIQRPSNTAPVFPTATVASTAPHTKPNSIDVPTVNPSLLFDQMHKHQ